MTRWGHRIDRRSVEKLCARLKQGTGWAGKCSPHIFRHTAGNFAAEMGLNDVRIAKYPGHRTLKMVKRYTGKVRVIRDFDAASPVNALGIRGLRGGKARSAYKLVGFIHILWAHAARDHLSHRGQRAHTPTLGYRAQL